MALSPRLLCSARTDILSIPALVLLLLALLPSLAAGDDSAVPSLKWRKTSTVSNAVRVFCSPVDADTVFVWTSENLLVSTDGGTTFSACGKGLKEQLGTVTALLVNPIQSSTIYIGTADKGVFVSVDDAKTFRPLAGREKGLTHLAIHSLAFAPNDASFTSIYATHGLDKKGLSLTIDGGKTWRNFGAEYAAAAISQTADGIFFAGKNAAQGTGFYRYDPARAWFCILLEKPQALLTSRLESGRVWFATESSGLRLTEDTGISMRQPNPGPQDAAIVSLAGGFDPNGQEIVYAYDPAGHGVLCTRDNGKTFQELNNGFEPTDWTREGAMLAGNADGSVLYACRNGELYRGAPPSGVLRLSSARVQPAAVVPGTESITITCRAAPNAAITINCSAVDGPMVLPMKAEPAAPGAKDCLYTATLPPISPIVQLPEPHSRHVGPVVLPVTAQLGQQIETRPAVVTLLPVLKDIVIYKGEAPDNAFFGDGHIRVGQTEGRVRGTKRVMHLSVAGEGTGGFNWPYTIDTWNHKLLTFYIRSDQAGAPDLFLSMLDDAGGSGVWSASQHSRELDLSQYISKVTGEYQFVAIPMIDFTFGTQCSPKIRQMYLRSATGAARTYDIDDMVLMVKPGPTVENPVARLQGDLKSATLRVRAMTRFGAVRSVTARINGLTVEMFDDGKHGDRDANDGLYGATVQTDKLPAGSRNVIFSAVDDSGTTDTPIPFIVPSRPPASAAQSAGPVRLDGEAAAFTGAQVLHLAGSDAGKPSLDARFVTYDRNLYCLVEVTDPGFVPRDFRVNNVADELAALPSVELRLHSPSVIDPRSRKRLPKTEHRVVAAPGLKQGTAAIRRERLNCFYRKTDRGYVLEFELPYRLLDVQDNPCDYDIGTITSFDVILNGSDGSHIAWASPNVPAAENPDTWGLLQLTDTVGPARFIGRGTMGNTLTLLSNKRLDRASAAEVAAYRVAGMTIQNVNVGSDNRTVELTATTLWKRDSTVRIDFAKVRSTEDLSFEPLSYTITGSIPATDEFIHEFLIGEAKTKIDPQKLKAPIFDEKAHPVIDEHWHYVKTDERVDLAKAAGALLNAAVPVHLYVHADADRTVQLWLGSDDGVRVAVNGKEAFVNGGSRGYAADQDKVPNIHLKKGWNDVMITVGQVSSQWELGLRIRSENGGTPEGVSYSADGPAKP